MPSTISFVHEESVPARFHNYSEQPLTIYKDTIMAEFCPAVGTGQLLTGRDYRVESASDDSDVEQRIEIHLIESVRQRTTPYHPQCDRGEARLTRKAPSVTAKV